MIYIEINGSKYPCKFSTFHTQTGKDAIRIISEAPIAEGFRLVNEEDIVIADYSDYVYLYREDGETVKEYTAESDAIIPAEGYVSEIPVNTIQQQIADINKRITDITPYTATKYGYFGEIEKVFYGVPSGNVTVFCDAENTVSHIEDRIIIHFTERLTDTTEITVMVQ